LVTESPITSIPAGSDVSVALVSLELVAHGYYVANTFEIDSACASFANNVCAHHGESPCECQLKVLQVFDKPSRSLNLIFHTYRGVTELFLDGDGIDGQNDLEYELQHVLVAESSKIQHLINMEISPYA
jgi:hypothetical protein